MGRAAEGRYDDGAGSNRFWRTTGEFLPSLPLWQVCIFTKEAKRKLQKLTEGTKLWIDTQKNAYFIKGLTPKMNNPLDHLDLWVDMRLSTPAQQENMDLTVSS